MGRSSSSRREHGGEGSNRGGCCEPDIGTATATMSESSDSDSPMERRARISFRSEHPLTAFVEATSYSTYWGSVDEKWNECILDMDQKCIDFFTSFF